MTHHQMWQQVFGFALLVVGVLVRLVVCLACDQAETPRKMARTDAEASFPQHVGTYRTNPRPQPALPRKTPWRRLALWWARGGPRRRRASLVTRPFRPWYDGRCSPACPR
ncbi:hypothetical protein WMF38_57195 [Sorangium sp. So ce118]